MGEERAGSRMSCDVLTGKSRESGSRPKVRVVRFLKEYKCPSPQKKPQMILDLEEETDR